MQNENFEIVDIAKVKQAMGKLTFLDSPPTALELEKMAFLALDLVRKSPNFSAGGAISRILTRYGIRVKEETQTIDEWCQGSSKCSLDPVLANKKPTGTGGAGLDILGSGSSASVETLEQVKSRILSAGHSMYSSVMREAIADWMRANKQ